METKKRSGAAKPAKDFEIKRDSSPKTHFFYEHEGERAVDPGLLVHDGIVLWHELMLSNEMHDTSQLWEYAKALLDSTRDAAMNSHVEHLRYQISMGSLAPKGWDCSKPYPYKGMLTSAIYFLEARRLCSEGKTDRAWHIIAVAYYNLGMNTIPSKARLNAKAAAVRHANDSEFTRWLVLEALKRLKGDDSITSIEKAKNAVIKLLEKNEKAKAEIEKLDKQAPEGTKHNKANSAMTRLRNTLDDWAMPKGPYPQMAEAFSEFARKRNSTLALEAPSMAWTTSEDVLLDGDSDCYMRIVSYYESGYTLTTKLSRIEDS